MISQERRRRTVRAVETTFAIIGQLQMNGESGVTDLATRMDMPKSTVHKHLQTLENGGYVQSERGRYRLGFEFLEHGGSVRKRCRIYTFGRPKVETVSETLDEMVVLSIREGHRAVLLFRSNDQYNLEESIPLGTRFPLHDTAAGKAMLGEIDDETVRDIIEGTDVPESTEPTATDADDLQEQLADVRRQGYAISEEGYEERVRAVSAAIEDEKTSSLGAISVLVPGDSPAVDHLDGAYAEAVRRAASELSLQLRHS